MDKEVSEFFEHGRVELLDRDFKSREAQLRLVMPCCLFLSVTPSLLGAGLIDGFKLHHPIGVWIPELTKDRFHPLVVEQVPLMAEKSNVALRQTAGRTLQNFQDLMQYMPFPEDLVATLPLGVYVECLFRCRLDDLPKVLLGVGQTPHHGIAEFRFALAEVLTTALHDVERWEQNRKRLSR